MIPSSLVMARYIVAALTLGTFASAGSGNPPTLSACAIQCVSSLFPSCTDSIPAQCVCDGTSSDPAIGMTFGECVFTNCGMSTAESLRGEIFSYCGISGSFGSGGFPGFSGFTTSAVASSTILASAPSGTATQTSSTETRSTGKSLQSSTLHSKPTQLLSHASSATASSTVVRADASATIQVPTSVPTGGFANSSTPTDTPSTDELGTGAKVGIGIGITIIALLLIAILTLLIRHRQFQRGHVPFTALEKAFPDGSPTNEGPFSGGSGSVMSGGSRASIPIYMDPNSNNQQSQGLTEAQYYEADSRPHPIYHEVDGTPLESYELPGAMSKRSYRSMLVELPLGSPEPTNNYIPEGGILAGGVYDHSQDRRAMIPSPMADNRLGGQQRAPSSARARSQYIPPARRSLRDSLWRNRRTIAHPPPSPSLSPSSSSPNSDFQRFEPSRTAHIRQDQPGRAHEVSSANTSSPTDSNSISPIDDALSSGQPTQRTAALQARAVRVLRLNSSVPRSEDDIVSPMSATPS